MRRCLLTLLFVLLCWADPASAQRYACVNTDYVLKSIPDYAAAQKRLDKYVNDWTVELQQLTSELMDLKNDFEQDSYLLPDNLRKRRQEEINEKEEEIRQLQQQHFAAGGDLDKKRAELLRPVQERVYNAIERVAREKNYAFVFDKAANSTLLFANKKYDISDDVLELLGYKPGATVAPPADPNDRTNKRPTNSEMRTPDANTPNPLSERRR